MLGGRHQVEQHHADAERLGARHALPELLEAGEQEAGIARLVKIGFIPPAAETPIKERWTPNRRQ